MPIVHVLTEFTLGHDEHAQNANGFFFEMLLLVVRVEQPFRVDVYATFGTVAWRLRIVESSMFVLVFLHRLFVLDEFAAHFAFQPALINQLLPMAGEGRVSS